MMPWRDMLVRAAAPPGAMRRTFGIVISGFSIQGMIGPLMFWLHHGPRRAAMGVIVMILTADGPHSIAPGSLR